MRIPHAWRAGQVDGTYSTDTDGPAAGGSVQQGRRDPRASSYRAVARPASRSPRCAGDRFGLPRRGQARRADRCFKPTLCTAGYAGRRASCRGCPVPVIGCSALLQIRQLPPLHPLVGVTPRHVDTWSARVAAPNHTCRPSHHRVRTRGRSRGLARAMRPCPHLSRLHEKSASTSSSRPWPSCRIIAWIAGDGPWSQPESAGRKLGVADCVRFLGWRTDRGPPRAGHLRAAVPLGAVRHRDAGSWAAGTALGAASSQARRLHRRRPRPPRAIDDAPALTAAIPAATSLLKAADRAPAPESGDTQQWLHARVTGYLCVSRREHRPGLRDQAG